MRTARSLVRTRMSGPSQATELLIVHKHIFLWWLASPISNLGYAEDPSWRRENQIKGCCPQGSPLTTVWVSPYSTLLSRFESIMLKVPSKFAPGRLLILFALTFAVRSVTLLAVSGPLLEVLPPNDQGWIRLRSAGATGTVYTLQASTNLLQWSSIATTHDEISAYPDAATPHFSNRYYRISAANKTASDDWKNEIHFPEEGFLSLPSEIFGADFRWVKFAIALNEPFRVYYQNSAKYDFHYDFAVKRLEPFRNLTPVEFDQVALHTNQQQVLLGTVLFPPYPNDSEFGIQFVGLDAYPPEFVARNFDLVRATVASSSNVSAFYVPAYEQARVAETNRGDFESRGIQVASADRWITGDDIYSTGWALGRLK